MFDKYFPSRRLTWQSGLFFLLTKDQVYKKKHDPFNCCNCLIFFLPCIVNGVGTGKVRYSISSGDPNESFKIDGGTGVIKTMNHLDHEKYSTVLLNVIATEQNGAGFSHAQVNFIIITLCITTISNTETWFSISIGSATFF